ncbi:MAG: ABC transporter substrate-binding protein [Anaerolineae bacterium]
MRVSVFMALSAIVLSAVAGCGATRAPVVQTVAATRGVSIQGTPQPPEAYARAETLYTTGAQWGAPSNWNPFMGSNYAMGTIGLCYETLFLYDPLADQYTPWLAESGGWIDATTYELKLRPGLTWSDGRPLTADDVKFTFELGRRAALGFSTLWDWLESIDEVDANTLRFRFRDGLYQEWANHLYNTPIVPQHLWQDRSAADVATGANEAPVGSGPYLAESHDDSHMVWVRNDGWWATEALGLCVAPKRIVDISYSSNNVALGLLLQGGLDLSNNLLPGVSTLVNGEYGLQTYYPEAPYMLSTNTAWLVMNLRRPPMDDLAFRRALAFAINAEEIAEKDYGNLVQAADPTGLLPVWDEYVDREVVARLGFRYDPSEAKRILAEAGYADADGDGFVEAPDGSAIVLELTAPDGWTDWMEATKIIADRLHAVGINAQPRFPGYDDYVQALLNGTFQLSLNNQPQMSNTVWSYYHWIFYDRLDDIATSQGGNYGRYDNPRAFDLVTQLDKTPIDDVAAMQALASQLQEIQLTDVPVIPLWYNGLWAQYSNAVWTNWPSSAEGANHYLPCTWRGYWNMSGIMMLTTLTPVAK